MKSDSGYRRLGLLVMAMVVVGSMAAAPLPGPSRKPNVVVFLADDMGFSDAACYGGEIATPNLDRLAAAGLRFTQFYSTARCWPSRACIMTGYYAQAVRRDQLPGAGGGAQGIRPKWARLLPELLRPLGYRSYHSGKWHLDGKPLEGGFDHSYSLEDHDRNFGPKKHFQDGRPLPAPTPESGYFTSTAIAQHAIKCLEEHALNHPGQPFFSYVCFTSPHFPLQAPPSDVARYSDKYLQGWDAVRGQRWQRMQASGLISCPLPPIERDVGPPYYFPEAFEKLGSGEIRLPMPWSELDDSQRRFQAGKMAIHAAMVGRMDREIGRVLHQIESMGQFDNTVVFFASDNGASAEIMVRGDGHNPLAAPGSAGTFLCLGPGWSSASNTPFRRHKTWVHEGGIASPLIVHWPAGIKARGQLRHTPGHLVDLPPTILSLAGGQWPQTLDGQSVPSPHGRSLAPVFPGDTPLPRDALWWLHEDNRAIRIGNWKLVSAAKQGSRWELYDLSRDRCETNNLAAILPEKARELEQAWNKQTEQCRQYATPEAPPSRD